MATDIRGLLTQGPIFPACLTVGSLRWSRGTRDPKGLWEERVDTFILVTWMAVRRNLALQEGRAEGAGWSRVQVSTGPSSYQPLEQTCVFLKEEHEPWDLSFSELTLEQQTFEMEGFSFPFKCCRSSGRRQKRQRCELKQKTCWMGGRGEVKRPEIWH